MNTSKLSINKAAELWRISRNTIYKSLENGSLSKGSDGKIDASEMIRVFGSPKSGHEKYHDGTTPIAHQDQDDSFQVVLSEQLEQELRQQISQLEQQLEDARERERWLRQQINDLMPKKIEYQSERKRGLLRRLFN
ncbi:MAG: plasmid replication DNA-binding protein [Gammaproteobacteria bacterium]|nr:plasmid replication DNA-binding protein [Gammaproteobacteria bacterium]